MSVLTAKILCSIVCTERFIWQTMSITYLDPTPLHLSATGTNLQAVLLSWTPTLSSLQTVEDIYETYVLTVMSGDTQPQVFQQNEMSHVYDAPQGSPPCEFYNFSVTATYVGTMTTYTGADCNAHSELFNVMLPSLPDIGRMESSLDYVLEKKPTTGFELLVSFMVSSQF